MGHPARPLVFSFFFFFYFKDDITYCINHRFCIGGLCKSFSDGFHEQGYSCMTTRKNYQDEAINNRLKASVRDLATPSGENANDGSLSAS